MQIKTYLSDFATEINFHGKNHNINNRFTGYNTFSGIREKNSNKPHVKRWKFKNSPKINGNNKFIQYLFNNFKCQ